MNDIPLLSKASLSHQAVVLRVDYNVAFTSDGRIADDTRIRETLPTINKLLAEENTIVLLSHLGRPNGKDEGLSLRPVYEHLKTLLPHVAMIFVPDVMQKETIARAKLTHHIVFVENIRFYPEEETNNHAFGHHLSSFGTAYVNDAFSVSHRDAASIVGIPKFIPSYAGILFENEVENLSKAITDPKHPLVAILGGAKISTKLKLIQKLTKIADHVLLGGGLANTVLFAEGKEVGESLVEKDAVESIKDLVELAKSHTTEIVLPKDVRVGKKDEQGQATKHIGDILPTDTILDIGPETEKLFASYTEHAKTIIWNGPVGYIENKTFSKGTDAVYGAITHNPTAFSVVGGGETLEALHGKHDTDKISYISKAGGAMLEFIENGALPGIEALQKSSKSS